MKGRISMNTTNQNSIVQSFIKPGVLARWVFLTVGIASAATEAALDFFARCPYHCAGSMILHILLCLTAMLCACGMLNAASGFRVWKSVVCSVAVFVMFAGLNAFCSIWYSLEFPDDLQRWILGKIGSSAALYILPFAAVMLACLLIKRRYSAVKA